MFFFSFVFLVSSEKSNINLKKAGSQLILNFTHLNMIFVLHICTESLAWVQLMVLNELLILSSRTSTKPMTSDL